MLHIRSFRQSLHFSRSKLQMLLDSQWLHSFVLW
jgi:hypothetical protein